MAPKILFVPGLWEGPTVFGPISTQLAIQGFSAEIAELPSTGTVSPGNPSYKDDVQAVRSHIQRLIQNDDLLLVLHSAGGFIGSEAMEGLSKKDRESQGHKHGVVGILFIAGAVFPEGFQHQPLPFARIEGGASYCANPAVIFFNDLTEEERKKWVQVMKTQPAEGWDDVISYTGWKDVPSVYLICENDQLLPVPLQEQLAALANSRVERCSAGHLAQLSQPGRVIEVIQGAIESL
ncbi:hypothetical protein N7462_002128 [Penicillium macrosclerotiorum]|uniref:uncharacterized protein n=1 Tax=Penicillium macrosclerotiorum TaxID=303699 RepID=UPI002548949C|nr:uncharacterized protein N7462_002128 [Penicillium macrosclerotiorum]KAJ5692705.1 hypothetical protein N7462_002128 [Penicillium macrosclerotiorum]